MSLERTFAVRGTEILATDSRHQYRQKLARIALDEMYQFVAVLDAEGTLLEVNRAALEGAGLTLADVEGKPFWQCFWWAVSTETQDTLREAIAQAARGEFVRYDVEIYGRAGGRETIVIDFSMIPVKDEGGRVVFIVPEGRDITEKKAHEREIAQKTLELQGLLERIRELDEIKTQFFANVSHELRTPLALILGPAQRLAADAGTLSAAERRESAEIIGRNAQMLLRHVNDLLDISKLEAGQLTIELQNTDVGRLVRFLASHFENVAAARAIDFVVDADGISASAIDPDKFQRVVMNLLGNAFKFVPDGGRVRLTLGLSPNDVRVSVEDSGPGVRPELRQAIFERFRQGDGGINRKAGGTGLGLAIAKEFVELHKGTIEVLDSSLGGALFRVVLPARQGSPDAPLVGPPPETRLDPGQLEALVDQVRPFTSPQWSANAESAAPDGRPRVLVVEDNVDMNRFITQSLSASYQVISAFDGREGLEKALAFHPELVVSDLMMPHVSGVEMIAEMRTRPELKMIPVLVLSAKADDELKAKLLEDGAQDFVVKPFLERELLVRARNLILIHRARQEAQRNLSRERDARAAADIASRSKDEFLAMIGHEMRNPLAPILTALELMRMRSGETAKKERTIIERNVRSLHRLVEDLLDVARVRSGKVQLDRERIEIAEVVATAVEMASPMLEAKQQRLSLAVSPTGLIVLGDPQRLAQVVSNLLTNASKYGNVGGYVAIAAELTDQRIVLRVTDNGSGIRPEMLPHVFELFTQDEAGRNRSQGGLGLGLAIVRSLVTLHGGTVDAFSEGVDRGSEFVVTLPADEAP